MNDTEHPQDQMLPAVGARAERPGGRPVPKRAERKAHDAALLRNTRRRVNRSRNFPENTCAASRHLHLMASQLASGKPYPMLSEAPQYCAMAMLAVLESLWKARTELARLKAHAEFSGPPAPLVKGADLP